MWHKNILNIFIGMKMMFYYLLKYKCLKCKTKNDWRINLLSENNKRIYLNNRIFSRKILENHNIIKINFEMHQQMVAQATMKVVIVSITRGNYAKYSRVRSFINSKHWDLNY